MSRGLTKEEGINTVYSSGGHVVILGAGASIAATAKDPERKGKILPSMNNFIEVIGLKDIVNGLPKELRAKKFETLRLVLIRSVCICAVATRMEVGAEIF